MITHPEKVLFPEDGLTKGELVAYYESVATVMLPHIAGRPVTLERYPAGIANKGFIQKDVTKGFPDWLERVAVPRRAGSKEPVHYPLISDVRGLMWLANQNTITPHVWCARVPELDRPDWCVFDLDPPGDAPAALRSGALAVRAALEELGLTSFVRARVPRAFTSSSAWTRARRTRKRGASPKGSAAGWCNGTRHCLPKSSSRRIERVASWWIRGETPAARPSRPPTPCEPKQALPSPRPAPGKRSSAAPWSRKPSGFGKWLSVSRKSATCGGAFPPRPRHFAPRCRC